MFATTGIPIEMEQQDTAEGTQSPARWGTVWRGREQRDWRSDPADTDHGTTSTPAQDLNTASGGISKDPYNKKHQQKEKYAGFSQDPKK